MIRFKMLFLLALLLPVFAAAQSCPCCKKRDAGRVAFDQKDYKTALVLWQEGLKLPDAAKCPTLKDLVAKAKSNLDAPPATEEEPVIMDQSGVYEADLIRFSTDPDKDGDGLADKEDQCPEVAGLIKNNGCPPPIALDAVGVLPEMVLVPGDTFLMGDLFREGFEDQVPWHEVKLSDFYLGKTEVTFQNYDAFCSATGHMKPQYYIYWDRSQRPVVNIDWYDAVEYCNWLSQQQQLKPAYTIDQSQKDPDNYDTDDAKNWIVTRIPDANGYRLPTEAEWEYAAREGGKKLRFGNGKDTANLAQMNFDASAQSKKPYSIVGKKPFNSIECGSLRSPNALGLHDMSGNVREWCADWYGDYQSAPATNPIGRLKGRVRIARGGSYNDAAHACRTMARINTTPTNKDVYLGFRVAASASPELKKIVVNAKDKPSILDQLDFDKDGIFDQDDRCPELGGPKIAGGCPETIQPNAANSITKGLAPIKGGTFTMGDLFGDGDGREPQHDVSISDFYLGRTEVTYDDFDAFCAATTREKPLDNGWGRGQRPVVNIQWYDAVEYCNWLSVKQKRAPAYTIDKNTPDPNNTYSGDSKRWLVTLNPDANGYRLPTEAEWEYAAREGGKKLRFGNGKNQADVAQINFDPSEKFPPKSFSYRGAGRDKTTEVGSLHCPNALGLHDMSGNVAEWCFDWYNETVERMQKKDPKGPGKGATRVLRGSDWQSGPQYCRVSNRNNGVPTLFGPSMGFRIASSFP